MTDKNLLSLPEGDGTDSTSTTEYDSMTDIEDKEERQEDTESHASSLVKSSSEASSCQMYDRLIFLAVPLAVIVKEGSTVPSRSTKDSNLESYSAFELGSKSQILSEIALQDMAGVKHVAVLTEDVRVNFSSVHLGYTQSKASYVTSASDALSGVGESSVTNPFYDFLNECLLRGLSGLLNLEACQFVWDQCFVVGFAKMLPLITASLVIGCAQELLGIGHEDSVVDSWVSYCHHCSVESVQRLLSTQCASELFDLFDKSSMYALDYNEDDDMLLQVVVDKLHPEPRRVLNPPPSKVVVDKLRPEPRRVLNPPPSIASSSNHSIAAGDIVSLPPSANNSVNNSANNSVDNSVINSIGLDSNFTLTPSASQSLELSNEKLDDQPSAMKSPKSPHPSDRENPFLRKLSSLKNENADKGNGDTEVKGSEQEQVESKTDEKGVVENKDDTTDNNVAGDDGNTEEDGVDSKNTEDNKQDDKSVADKDDAKVNVDKESGLSQSNSDATVSSGDSKLSDGTKKPKKSKKSW
eukprot:CAMPEP_0114444964 /NCGR_PEP_ID=MMETSP0103-20121206/18366_1 /TAXON_ID=37642 ORGANISM="Paraphysomonas imperforata, Strain PA2" /NCGR_SAMPLE_ID=MMETSP0103 /ASSEMBLY_ACC=CAM_ASM_000201 /LENGTH=523 /DNA_ID=CAMNT_0001616535 /DNA_START=273 /DNA_END=1843 /DNA_ORIENTATION=+